MLPNVESLKDLRCSIVRLPAFDDDRNAVEAKLLRMIHCPSRVHAIASGATLFLGVVRAPERLRRLSQVGTAVSLGVWDCAVV